MTINKFFIKQLILHVKIKCNNNFNAKDKILELTLLKIINLIQKMK